MAITTRKRKHYGDFESTSRIDDLNDALLGLIFTRLSLWSDLAISKCVSKRWKTIISNPDFTPKLLPQSYAFTLVQSHGECPLTEHPYFQKHKFSLDFIPGPHKLIVANTDDLIVAYHHIDHSQTGEYYVANPLTKQYIVVSVPFAKPISQHWEIMVGIAGFVDGVSTVNVSHRNNNNHGFRIVLVLPGNPRSSVQIYSSETGQWKTYLLDGFPKRYRPAITWKNKIHWMDGSKIVVIDPFNIDNVAPRVVKLPTGIGNRSSTLGFCQNRLRIAQFEECSGGYYQQIDIDPFDFIFHRAEKRIKLWEIDDYDNVDNLGSNNMAKVKLVIDFECTRSLVECPSGYHQMLCCHPNDPQVIYFYYNNETLFYLNAVEQKCKKVDDIALLGNDTFVIVHPK